MDFRLGGKLMDLGNDEGGVAFSESNSEAFLDILTSHAVRGPRQLEICGGFSPHVRV